MDKPECIIACLPKDEDEQKKLGLVPRVGVIYNLAKCDRCNNEMLISQEQEKMQSRGKYKAWCANCVYKLAMILPEVEVEAVNLQNFQ